MQVIGMSHGIPTIRADFQDQERFEAKRGAAHDAQADAASAS
jgi:hypothetical protein